MLLHNIFVTSQELKRWLTKQGCAFGIQNGSHLKVFLGKRETILPMHGGKRDLASGTVKAIGAGLDRPKPGEQ